MCQCFIYSFYFGGTIDCFFFYNFQKIKQFLLEYLILPKKNEKRENVLRSSFLHHLSHRITFDEQRAQRALLSRHAKSLSHVSTKRRLGYAQVGLVQFVRSHARALELGRRV